MTSVFEFRDYKRFLLSTINLGGRGARSALAQAMACQSAYVTRVLSGSAHLSLEQAELAGRHLGMSKEEIRFFLLLVQLGRAGTTSLKRHLEEQLEEFLERRLALKERIDVKATLSREHQAAYYGVWYYSALHILLTIPDQSTDPAELGRTLGISAENAKNAIAFLVRTGLVQQRAGRYSVGTSRIHLDHDSPMIQKHHANWRIQAIRAIERERRDSLHYSSVISVSAADASRIRERLIREIQELKKVIKDSPEEELRCFSLDFFRVDERNP